MSSHPHFSPEGARRRDAYLRREKLLLRLLRTSKGVRAKNYYVALVARLRGLR